MPVIDVAAGPIPDIEPARSPMSYDAGSLGVEPADQYLGGADRVIGRGARRAEGGICLNAWVTDTYRRMLLASRPQGLVEAANLRLDDSASIPEPAEGQALIRVQYSSIDPTIRTWMDDAPGYLPPIGLGEVVRSGGVGEVVASRSDRYQPGQLVFGMLGWQEYALADEGEGAMTVLPPASIPLWPSASSASPG